MSKYVEHPFVALSTEFEHPLKFLECWDHYTFMVSFHCIVNHYDVRFLSHFQVCVENLCSKQAAEEVEVRGPPVSKAFDHQGNPTKVWNALLLFFSWRFLSLRKFGFLSKRFVWWDYLETAIGVHSHCICSMWGVCIFINILICYL